MEIIQMGSGKKLGTTERDWIAVLRFGAFVIPGICYFSAWCVVWGFTTLSLHTVIWPALVTALTGIIGFIFPEAILGFFAGLLSKSQKDRTPITFD
jgi:H+/Cl- antiporter ClcA